jgi:hypothetical protein
MPLTKKPHPLKKKKRLLDEVDMSPSLARRFLEHQALRDIFPLHPGRKPLKRMRSKE